MYLINAKSSHLIFLSGLLMAIFSCTKTPTSNFQRIDTIRYEAILDNSSNDWCVSGFNPHYMGADTDLPAPITASECGETKNFEVTFTIKKYSNNYLYLGMSAYNMWPSSPPWADSAITLNIYLNGALVATQTGKVKDSLKYTAF